MERSTASDAELAGAIVAGTYRIERRIGSGGMGVVWEASHQRVPRRVAVKVLSSVPDPTQFARFRQEAEITSRLRHPNIVDILDFDSLPDGTPCMVMELLEGESLGTRLRRGAMSLDDTLAIVRQVASALDAAHAAGVVHRDLKPDNVFLVARAGETVDLAKVLDFGISKVHGAIGIVTQENVVLGTPQYMAPEQASGDHDLIDERADQFALAVMAYQMLSGKLPFSGTRTTELMFKIVYEPPLPLATLVPELPVDVVAAIERALEKRAEDRFPDLSALVEALTGSPLAARPSSGRLNQRTTAVARGASRPPTAATRLERKPPTDNSPVEAGTPASVEPAVVKRRAWIPVLGIGAVALGVVAILWARAAQHQPSPVAPELAVRPDAALLDAAPVAASPDAVPPSDAPAKVMVDAGVAIAVAPEDARSRVAAPRRTAVPAEIQAMLEEGEAALIARKLEDAHAKGQQVASEGYAEGYVLRTVAACAQLDRQAARAWHRMLVNAKRADLAATALARCAKAGYPID